MWKTILVIAAGLILCSLGVAQSGDSGKLPDGEGKQLTERVCTACHAIETVVTERHTNAEWQKIVDDMVARGADGTDAEFKTIVEYLTKNFGPTTSTKEGYSPKDLER